MDKKTLLALRFELEALTIDFWNEVDAHGGRDAASYYTADALFATSVREYRGRDAINAFYNRREERGPRVSLHVVQNFKITVENAPSPGFARPPEGVQENLGAARRFLEGEGRVRCQYILSLFAADGVPVLPSRPAIMMAVADEAVLQQPDGTWLFAERRLLPLFRDETPTTG